MKEDCECEQCDCNPCQCEDWILKPDFYDRGTDGVFNSSDCRDRGNSDHWLSFSDGNS